jgi:mycothiol synthase
MSDTSDMPQPVLVIPSLQKLPLVSLPQGYFIRSFRPGEEGLWNHLLDAAFDRPSGTTSFAEEMASDPIFEPERIKFLFTEEEELVATASAWHRPAFGARYGYLHWVGAHPEYRGRRLGYWVSLAAMHHASEEGRERMLLETSFGRLPALKLYLNLGFRPVLTDSRHAENWRQVLAKLDYPERFEVVLNGPLVQLASNDCTDG